MTIDELAREAGVTTTTVRLYQTRGLLPRPELDGRVGRYSEGHLARLLLVGRLQQRGFSLAAIKELVDTWESGRSLGALLGLEAQVASGTGPGESLDLSAEQFAALFPGGANGTALMERALELGLAERTDGGFRIPRLRFLQVGASLVGLGIPVEEVFEEYGHLQQATDAIAARFVMLFERHVWEPFAAAGLPDERLSEVANVLGELRGLAAAVVETAVQHSLHKATANKVADHAGHLGAGHLGAGHHDEEAS